MDKDIDKIPVGLYCYTFIDDFSENKKGCPKIKLCPYWTSKIIGDVEVTWCNYLGLGSIPNGLTDEEWKKLKLHYNNNDDLMNKELPLFLLWDGCKECGENYGEEDDPNVLL